MSPAGSRVVPEAESFTDLIREHQGVIRSLARIYAETLEDQEDLAQEICLQLWRAYPTYSRQAKFSTWMYAVALNTAISALRRHRRRPPSRELLDVPGPPPPDDEGRLELFYQALRNLSEAERALILLWLEELSYEEIGKVLGVTKGAVSVRLVRVREKLREEVRRLQAPGLSHGRL